MAATHSSIPIPPFDPQVVPILKMVAARSSKGDGDGVAALRRVSKPLGDSAKHILRSDQGIDMEERNIPGPRGDIPVAIIRPRGRPSGVTGPGILHLHGGGMIAGDYYFGLDTFHEHVTESGAVIVSVNYRLAPENTGLALVEDCYAALVWVGDHLADLGIDGDRIMVAGASAGAGLAAGTALMARDRGGPSLFAQCLICPMLDDRNNTASCQQFRSLGLYTGEMNEFGWSCVLGDETGKDGVSPYIAPARATDLAGLPQAYIEVGSCEPFRDESVAYASKLWECGVQAALHVWPGGFHGFSTFVSGAAISKGCNQVRSAWLKRALS